MNELLLRSRQVAEEQVIAQRHKHVNRSLEDYDDLLLPDAESLPQSLFQNMLALHDIVDGKILRVSTMLLAIAQQTGTGILEKPLRWLDVGGGTGHAQAQYSWMNRKGTLHVKGINQDVVSEHEIPEYHETQRIRLRQLSRFMPEKLLLDICLGTSERRSHLITSVFSIPYWNDPLRGIVNMYNNLEVGGIMSIATDSDVAWSALIRYGRRSMQRQEPLEAFINLLAQYDIPHGLTPTNSSVLLGRRYSQRYCGLSIQKVHDNHMELHAVPETVRVLPEEATGFAYHKVVRYQPPDGQLVTMC